MKVPCSGILSHRGLCSPVAWRLRRFKPECFGARLPTMDRPASIRPFITWVLYFCVLFNVICCGLSHGQALGFALNGIGGRLCSLTNDTSVLQAKQDGGMATSDWTNPFSCPTCSATFLTLIFLIGVAWLLACASPSPFKREVRSQAPRVIAGHRPTPALPLFDTASVQALRQAFTCLSNAVLLTVHTCGYALGGHCDAHSCWRTRLS